MANIDTSLPPETTGAAAQLAAEHSAEHPLKLYGGWFCPFVQRSWITLREKKIPHQYVEINPYKKEAAFVAMNPRGLVPTLAVPVKGEGQDRRPLFESNIICEYLDDAYSDKAVYGPQLLPSDPYERARCRLWIDHISTRIIPAFYNFYSTLQTKSTVLTKRERSFRATSGLSLSRWISKVLSSSGLALVSWISVWRRGQNAFS